MTDNERAIAMMSELIKLSPDELGNTLEKMERDYENGEDSEIYLLEDDAIYTALFCNVLKIPARGTCIIEYAYLHSHPDGLSAVFYTAHDLCEQLKPLLDLARKEAKRES